MSMPTNAVDATARSKVTLTGTQETLMVTLHARHQDALLPRPILGDEWAGRTAELIDYDFSKLGFQRALGAYVSLRARVLDRWTEAFLTTHPAATVVHLACGLDSRSLRVPWNVDGGTVRWIDVDLPDVVELRKKLVPDPEGDYALVAASVLDDDWLKAIPADRPTVIVMEGLTMYLQPDDGKALISRLCAHFGGGTHPGELLFDATGWIIIALQKWMSITAFVRHTNSQMTWSIDDPKALESRHDCLRLLEERVTTTMEGIEEFPIEGRIQMSIFSWLLGFRYVGRLLCYAF
jgi:O-methyltransferase involved in polyketide biosynthesis